MLFHWHVEQTKCIESTQCYHHAIVLLLLVQVVLLQDSHDDDYTTAIMHLVADDVDTIRSGNQLVVLYQVKYKMKPFVHEDDNTIVILRNQSPITTVTMTHTVTPHLRKTAESMVK